MGKLIDETGNKHNMLFVLSRAENNKWGQAMWLCQCDCGSDPFPVIGYDLRSGHTQSCGCLQKEKTSEACKGKPKSKEHVRKISEAHIGLHAGEKNGNFKHGLCGTKEYLRMKSRKRRVLKVGAEGTHTTDDNRYIYQHQNGLCARCRRPFIFEELTEDHIIALDNGGSDYASNIQMLCGSCNSSKGAHHNTDYRDYIPLFLN